MVTRKSGRRPKGGPRASTGRHRTPRAGPTDHWQRVETALFALRDEVASLRASLGQQGGSVAAAPGLSVPAVRLNEIAAMLEGALGEVPKAQDFQPLADHLYTFAESAPRLIESLDAVRQAVGPVEAAARVLGEVAETLAATHHNWSESLLRLPRAEDYEPLATPLREFARVSPALAETLRAVVRAVAPLPELVGQLSEATITLQGLRSTPTGTLRSALVGATESLGAARSAIREALATLPTDPAYSKFATQLRELATVSPSLMDWLRQVPSLSLPLGEAIAALEQVGQDLEEAERSARRALESD